MPFFPCTVHLFYVILWILSDQAAMFVCVSVLWGGTNPFMKKAGTGVESVKSGSKAMQTMKELYFLFRRWQVLHHHIIDLLKEFTALEKLMKQSLIGVAKIVESVCLTFSTRWLFL